MSNALGDSKGRESGRRHKERMGSTTRTTIAIWSFTVAVFALVALGEQQGILTPYEDIAIRGLGYLLLAAAIPYTLMPKRWYKVADIAVRFIAGAILFGGLAYGAFNEPNNLTHYLIWLLPYQLFVVYIASAETGLRIVYFFMVIEAGLITAALVSGTMTVGDPKFTVFISMMAAQFLSALLLMAVTSFIKKSEAASNRAAFLAETAEMLEKTVRDMEEARSAALMANHTKTNFLAMMSHELRTPLNAILGFSEILTKDVENKLQPQKTKEYANDIYESANHLLALINDVLDLAKIEAGKMERYDEILDLDEVLEGAKLLVTPLADKRNISLDLGAPKDLQIIADPRLMKQVLVNIFSNAIKYGREGGEVSLEVVAKQAAGLTLTVNDNGYGMDQETLDRVMEPFVRGQANANHSDTAGGTGLGLPIVKSLIELHGGQLRIESKVDQGTSVSVHLPPACIASAIAKSVGATAG